MADEVTVAVCNCKSCQHASSFTSTDKNKFNFHTQDLDLQFPKIVNPRGEIPADYGALAAILETQGRSQVDRKKHAAEVVQFLTYLDTDNERMSLKDYIDICEYLYANDLEVVIKDDRTASDFLHKISMLFVKTWHSLVNLHDEGAEWAAHKFRRFLTYTLTFPIITRQVKAIFFTSENWKSGDGPLQIIEILCKDYLACVDTVSLLVNLTRIETFCFDLNRTTKCVQIIQDQYSMCYKHILGPDELGGLLLLLFMNLTGVEKFLEFLIDGKSAYFMNVVLLDLITNYSSGCKTLRSSVWPFLRNLALLEKGRERIIGNLDLYLGQILYPITGPEQLTDEETGNLPLEVRYLPDTKTRVQDPKIRNCILDILFSLCRYKKDRILIRDADVYQILKHYHLAEKDEQLLEKIEDLVNVLIRNEGSEIEVDDLMEGLQAGDKNIGPLVPKSTPLHVVDQ